MDNNYNNQDNPYRNMYYGNSYGSYGQPQPTEPKRPKKRRFGKAVLAVFCAILLGAVAGCACYGVNYAGHTFFPIKNEAASNSTSTGTSVVVPSQTTNNVVNTQISVAVMDVSEMVDRVISSVVAITGTVTTTSTGFWGNQTYKSQVSGSGIIIGITDTELLVVTNDHVVDDVDNLKLSFYDGTAVSAVVKGTKSSKDLAIVAINLTDIPSDAIYTIAELGESSDLKVGEAAIAIGNALGYGISVTTGCISALNKTVTVEDTDYTDLIQTDAAINPGNSGGALFNSAGAVVGINSVKMGSTGVEGMGYAISISSVKDIISELSVLQTQHKYNDDERGYLGITGISITSEISDRYGYPVGVAIRTITEGEAADKAGLVKNDIIVSVAGNDVKTINEIIGVLQYYPAGAEVSIEYYHMSQKGEYELHKVTVVLSAKSN